MAAIDLVRPPCDGLGHDQISPPAAEPGQVAPLKKKSFRVARYGCCRPGPAMLLENKKNLVSSQVPTMGGRAGQLWLEPCRRQRRGVEGFFFSSNLSRLYDRMTQI